MTPRSADRPRPGQSQPILSGAQPARCLVLWFPAWSVRAWSLAEGQPIDVPLAPVAANRITACSAAAVAEGVVIGQRRREAQSRCPTLQVIASDEARDVREFEPVVACIEELSPGVQVLRPGQQVRLLGDGPVAGSGSLPPAEVKALPTVAPATVCPVR